RCGSRASRVSASSQAQPRALPPAHLEDTAPQQMYSYAPLVQQVAPAVVNIYTKRTIRTSGSSLFNDPFFRRFFGEEFGQPREREQRSLGSGVIVRKDGIVVTNRHVIAGADQITVSFADRREFEAELILEDEQTDLAVLRIDAGAEDLPALEFADSDTAQVGDIVFAIGNPFGVGQTVTSGIVSAMARTEVGVSDYDFFIQTDAAINPGNSGGALVGMDGKLYGINTVILSRSGGSHGIGFAIPANMVSRVVKGAITDGKIVRPWLGAGGQAVDNDLAQSIGLDRPGGVMINRLYGGGPAENAGLRAGDVVLSVNGFEIADPQALTSRLAALEVGKVARLSIYREGRRLDLDLPLDPPPEDPPANRTQLSPDHPFGGATVANLSPALAYELDWDPLAQGVIVVEIERGSRAHRIRLRPGDIFLRINGREVESVAQLDAYWSGFEGDLDVEIQRGNRVISATIRP
ncbi:MAG: Do family serine endopeptidase, partial [Alphaproteobacteria bacterium]|nr:Do family serine endopeptidase [Alphaproteobacteria bacterium]